MYGSVDPYMAPYTGYIHKSLYVSLYGGWLGVWASEEWAGENSGAKS